MLPGVPCLSVLVKTPKPLAVKEDAFVFSVVSTYHSIFVGFDMISVLIYAELKSAREAQMNCIQLCLCMFCISLHLFISALAKKLFDSELGNLDFKPY